MPFTPTGQPPRTGYPPTAPYVANLTAPAERNWAVAAHLSGFVAAFFALGFLGPLIVLLTEGGRSPFVRSHAVEALNFNLSVLVWIVISAMLILVIIGIPMLLGVGLLYIVASIRGAVAASRGDAYRYPLTIRFVN
jgi:hypothetical protein